MQRQTRGAAVGPFFVAPSIAGLDSRLEWQQLRSVGAPLAWEQQGPACCFASRARAEQQGQLLAAALEHWLLHGPRFSGQTLPSVMMTIRRLDIEWLYFGLK